MAKPSKELLELLTRDIDPDTEAYLRARGLDWFFKARRKVQRALEQE